MPPTKKPSATKTAGKPGPAGDTELDLIASLAAILNSTGLTEIELDRKGVKVRVAKTVHAVASIASPPPAAHGHVHVAPAAEAPSVAAARADHPGAVKSPMVGTIYRASTPGAPPFVDVGTIVKQGQTLLIIEAMKTMNQIPSPRDGRVTHVFVDNGHPVEYGEPLVVIE